MCNHPRQPSGLHSKVSALHSGRNDRSNRRSPHGSTGHCARCELHRYSLRECLVARTGTKEVWQCVGNSIPAQRLARAGLAGTSRFHPITRYEARILGQRFDRKHLLARNLVVLLASFPARGVSASYSGETRPGTSRTKTLSIRE